MLHHARDCSLMPVIILAMIGQLEHLPITAHAALSRQQSHSGTLLGQARGALLLPAPAFTPSSPPATQVSLLRYAHPLKRSQQGKQKSCRSCWVSEGF